MPSEVAQAEVDNQAFQASKRFKSSFHEKLKKDVENLKNAENYSQSNLLRLQIAELLKEICPNEGKLKKCNATVELLVKNLKSLKPKSNILNSDLSVFAEKIKIPLGHLCSSMEGSYSFIPPEEVHVIGSFATNTYINTDQKIGIDMSVVMPKDFFADRDFLNYRYFLKRNLYLAHVYLQLVEKKSLANARFQFTSGYGSSYKPLLLIQYNESLQVTLHFVPHPDAFKLHRFNPNQSNVRASWFLDKFKPTLSSDKADMDSDSPTPNYNQEILADLRANENNELLKLNLTTKGIREAIQLTKLWAFKRELNKGHGSFDSHTISMFVMHLISTDQVNPVMSEYQIFRTILMALSGADWSSTGISIKANKLTVPGSLTPSKSSVTDFQFEDFHKHFDVVFADHSGYLNLCGRMSLNTFEKLRHDATLSLRLLNDEMFNCFEQLFIKNHCMEMSFDALVCVDPFEESDYYDRVIKPSQRSIPDSSIADFFNKTDLMSLKPMQKLLRKALENRISLSFFQLFNDLKWDLLAEYPKKTNNPVVFGLIFKEGYDNVLIKGPNSTSPEAKHFRDFWGSKSELRRFHDTSICEAVYFEALNLAAKRLIYSQIIRHVFSSHLAVESDHLKFVDRQMNPLLSLPAGVVDNYGTGEEKLADAVNTYNELAQILKALKGLPLSLNNVNGLSSTFRYTDVFAPLPACFNYDKSSEKNMCYKSKSRTFPTYPLGPVCIPYVKPLLIACQLESSGKWPDNLECIKHLKSAFHIQIAEQLRETLGVLAHPHTHHCDLLYKGYVFRLLVFTMSELFCLKTSKNEQGVLCTVETEQSIAYEKSMTLIPRLNSFLHSIQQKYSSFGGVCRLVKRWLSSQFLIDYVEEEAVDLMCAYFYVNPQSYEAPKSVITGFLRFLDFISNFDWKNQVLLIDFNNEMKDTEIKEIREDFKQRRNKMPPVFIVTPFDINKNSSIWTAQKPSMQQLCRIVLLARQSLQQLKKNMSSFETSDSFKDIFRPSYDIFDVVINLKVQYCVKAYQKVDISKGTFLPKHRPFKSNENETNFPVVDFDPVAIYLCALRAAYGELAYFYVDVYGDSKICVLWRPQAVNSATGSQKSFKFSLIDPATNKLELNLTAILDDFKIIGSELVESITLKSESSIFK